MPSRAASVLLAIVALATVAPQPTLADSTPAEPAVEPAAADPPPTREHHPLPRVVVDVVASKGALEASAIQAPARAQLWAKAIGCYKLGARRDQSLEIDHTFGVEIASGRVKVPGAKKKKAKKPARGQAAEATPTQQVERCLRDALPSVEMPRARRSTARIRVRIWPGDEPVE